MTKEKEEIFLIISHCVSFYFAVSNQLRVEIVRYWLKKNTKICRNLVESGDYPDTVTVTL